MSNTLEDTPRMLRPYCPDCEPDADPTQDMLEVFWCGRHVRTRFGADDQRVTSVSYLSGSAESGGEDNRRWCAFFARKDV